VKINMMPGMASLGRKDDLYRVTHSLNLSPIPPQNYKRLLDMWGAAWGEFLPITFMLPRQGCRILKAFIFVFVFLLQTGRTP
jgi:hypothetical protein